MLDVETKNRINTARDILVGKVPDPKSQVEQITIALIYKFMDDMDVESEELGGKRTFFVGEYAKYAWRKIFDPRQSGYELLNLYSEAITKMDVNPGVPKLFRDIFKNAYLPYRDPETLKSFLKIINEFDYSHSEKLGDAFEFLLSILGSQGDAGQFRTPRHIIDFMVEIIDPKKNEIILDPACGTAGFLISSYKHIVKQNSSNFIPEHTPEVTVNGTQSVNEVIISTNGYSGDKLTADERRILADNIHGYDISPDMVRLSLVNMYLHGIKEPHISEYDTLTSEDHWNQYCDVILANPPFMSPKGGIRPHKRFSVQSNRSEVLFVDYIAEHLTPDGRACVIVPEGIIFQSGNAYKQLRKMLVEKYLVGVISLPAGVFQPYSGVKTSILWLDKALAKKTADILFLKIENDGFDLGAQRRAIKKNDLPNALQNIILYKNRKQSNEVEKSGEFNLVLKDIILSNSDCSLSGERYFQRIIISSDYDLVPCGSFLRCNVQTFDPRTNPNEKYELWSIPAFDLRRPEILKGDSIGSAKKILVPGDVLLSRIVPHIRRSWVVSDTSTSYTKLGSTEWIIFNNDKLNSGFLKWIFRSDVFHEQFMRTVTGVGGSLSRASIDAMGEIRIPVPSLAVQHSIMTELDSYQKIIDGARMVVENYKPRIEIDPEWKMVELESLCEIKSGGTPSRNVQEFWNGTIPWVGSTVCKDVEVTKAEEYITEIGLNKSAAKLFPEGTTLIALVGATIGKTGFLTFPCATNQNIAGLSPKNMEILDKKYLFYIAQSLYPKFMELAEGKFRMANLSFIKTLKIPLPDLPVQQDIVKRIESEENVIKGNADLIIAFEQKIKDRIAKVWGE